MKKLKTCIFYEYFRELPHKKRSRLCLQHYHFTYCNLLKRFFLDKRKTAVYDHCRAGSEIIRRGRKTMTCVWGHLLLVTLVHAIWSSNCSELYSKVIVGVIKNILTLNTCFWILRDFLLNGLKCCLGVSCFLLTLKACDSWEPHRIHKIYIASFTQFLSTPVKTAFPFNENEGKGLLEWNAVVACLKINQHSLHPRIFTG